MHNARGADLSISSTPPRAGVWLDGQWLGATPVRGKNLPPGEHVVRLARFGSKTLVKHVSLRKGANNLAFDLAALADSGISISSDPPGAEVRLDGQPCGVTPVELRGVPPGAHAVRLTLVGYLDWTGPGEIVGRRGTSLGEAPRCRQGRRGVEAGRRCSG